ncbi:MAG: acyl-CoA/acyl-ACP dehydrogenase [Halioglobus sp.]|nr:acyl-CoA/acyl-ACP dehydrogenase [Halioglobus sp.]
MDIKLTEEQAQLQDSAARFMDDQCTFDFVRKMESQSKQGFCRDMWKKFAEMGWLGIMVPEGYDGMGMSLLDTVVLIRELGRHICPSPFLFTSVLAADLISESGTEKQKSELLPQIVLGEKIYAFAYQEFSRKFTPEHIKLQARQDGDSFVLNGSKLFVEFADGADTLIVAARTGDANSTSGLTLLLVDRESVGITSHHMPTMSRDRHYQVDFDNVKVPDSARLGAVGKGWEALEPSLHKAIIAFCAYTNGAGFEMHEHATQYARERVQFGRPIGQMQTIQGYLAQMIMELYGADMLTMFTAFQIDRGRDARGYVAKSKAFSSETVGHVMDVSSQIFGGMGYMEEQDTTLFLRRGKQYQLALGGSEYWEDVIAEEIIDREDPAVLT